MMAFLADLISCFAARLWLGRSDMDRAGTGVDQHRDWEGAPSLPVMPRGFREIYREHELEPAVPVHAPAGTEEVPL